MEHLALEILPREKNGASQYAWLPENASISITDTSEIFDKGNVWSHDFQLNIPANAHIFGTAGEMHGSRLHEQIDKRKARLWVEGLPLFLGYLRLADEVDVDKDGNVDVTFESGMKTFEEMIDDLNARDIPLLGNHLLGVAVWRERTPYVRITYDVTAKTYNAPSDDSGKTLTSSRATASIDVAAMQDRLATRWPKYVVHEGTFQKPIGGNFVLKHSDTINTDYPYDDEAPMNHPYCNVDISYQSRDASGNAVRGYTIHEVNYKPGAYSSISAWPNTAPCFYTMYWLRALMTHLGIHIDENQMQSVEDLRRLFMMNTLCAYKEPEEEPAAAVVEPERQLLFGVNFPMAAQFGVKTEYDISESKGVVKSSTVKEIKHEYMAPAGIKNIGFNIRKVEKVEEETVKGHPAYATSDNFPNVEASKIIEALQDGFGIRFLFSSDFTRVRIVLLRTLFQSSQTNEIKCEIIDYTKSENKIRGFLISYGIEEDTAFKLPFYDRLLDKKHDADTTGDNYTFTPSEYSKIINAVSSFNKHLYYTPTGNSYAYKVDKDATRYKELFPSLFEVAGYMDAVDGMCVEEDSFDQRTLGFTPLIMNDTNMTDERAGSTRQRFSAYVGEEMEMTLIGHGGDGGGFFSVSGDMFFRTKVTDARLKYSDSSNYTDAEWSVDLDIEGYIFETYTLRLYDNFKPNDDGVSPIEKHEWGLTLGIMRGSGNDMEIVYQPDPDDNEENDTWELKPGSSSTAHPDTCDDYGKEWDYKGTRRISTAEQAQSELLLQFPDSQAAFTLNSDYISDYDVYSLPNETGAQTSILVATRYGTQAPRIYDGLEMLRYTGALAGHTVTEMMAIDATGVNVGTTENPYIVQNLIVEIGSTSQERGKTLLSLCEKAYSGEETADVLIDNGVGSRFGRFSLKLRAEKPNPYFDHSQPKSESNRRYLKIDNENLRGRGLMDQFYKEYSYWVRNARIAKMTVRMELAQLLSIDKTKRVRVGDIIGFIRKMEYQVNNQSGLGLVTMEIMYI